MLACDIVSGESIVARGCDVYTHSGCDSVPIGDIPGVSGEVCTCKSDLCNSAVMTSSLGHVITVVALLIIGYLM